MKPSQRDIWRIEQETGAYKVTVTDTGAARIMCDLLFIRQGLGTTVKADFDMADYDRFMDTARRVKQAANRQFAELREKTARAAIYIRQAVGEDDKRAAARTACEQYAAASSMEVVGVYEDIGVSGLQPAALRVGLSQVIALAEDRQIEVVIAPGINHFGRNAALVEELINMLSQHQVQLALVE